jgi:dihydrofolate synthase/folylpolyglutamate synthase
MAVETGMGGRLDATNILDPLVSVITVIELEHTEYLGNTIAAIAGEKAGIIKPSKPLILAEQPVDALNVFREHTALCNSPLLYLPDCAELQNVRVDKKGTSFNLILKKTESQGKNAYRITKTFRDLFVPMPGEVQAKNASLAVLAVKTAFPMIKDHSIYKGLAVSALPARFERITEPSASTHQGRGSPPYKPPVIIDGAHTPRSIEMCLETFCGLYGNEGILVFGCGAEKDVHSMASLCVSCFSVIVITKPGTFKKSNPNEIHVAFVRESAKLINSPEIIFIPETNEAIKMAINLAREKELPLLGTGSFYLAGEIRDSLLK